MSEVYIHYSTLDDAIKKSQKARSEISGYIEEIKKKITTPISNLSGSDSSGYASTASSLAWQKINKLTDKSSKLVTFEQTVRDFSSKAKSKDKYVSDQIETVAGLYVQERKWYQKAGDWLYNTFCVDIPNKWDWTRGFVDCAKRVAGDIGDTLEKVHDWFKYGDGKYILNITLAVVGVVAAVAGTIAAIVAIPFTAGATLPIVIGCIGAAASAIGTVITIVNASSTIESNAKALSLSGNLFDEDDGNPGAARYYGNISTLSQQWHKTDMGDASANNRYEIGGKIIDTTKVVADTTAFVCNIASLGNVKDYRYKNPNDHITGYSFTWQNIKKNLRADMGFNVSKSGIKDGKHPFNPIGNFFAKGYEKKFSIDGSYVIPESVVSLFKGVKIYQNTSDTIKNVQTISGLVTDGIHGYDDINDGVNAVFKLLSFSKITSVPTGNFKDLWKNGNSIFKDITGWVKLLAG